MRILFQRLCLSTGFSRREIEGVLETSTVRSSQQTRVMEVIMPVIGEWDTAAGHNDLPKAEAIYREVRG